MGYGVAEGLDVADMSDTISEPIHEWFELTYAQYLTIPRSVLQSMPAEWQERFVTCLRELDSAIDWRPEEGRYWVRLKDKHGRFTHDPLMDYERGRRVVPMRDGIADRATRVRALLEQSRGDGQ